MDCRWTSPGRRKETDRKTKKEKDWSDICVGKKKEAVTVIGQSVSPAASWEEMEEEKVWARLKGVMVMRMMMRRRRKKQKNHCSM